jgi:predicted component of type VI protein secretion system
MTAYWLEYRGIAHPLLRRETLLGRSEECAIYLPHAQVSRIHAVVRLKPTAVELVDLGSMNGTRLNGEKLRGPRELRDGDTIRIGTEELVMRVDSRKAAPPRPESPPLALVSTDPADHERAALDAIELAEGLLSSPEGAERPQETAHTVRALLDQALAKLEREMAPLDRETAARIARIADGAATRGGGASGDDMGAWLDDVAARVQRMMGQR